MTQYLGLDLLDIAPSWNTPPADAPQARVEVVESPFGARFYDFRDKAPRWNRKVLWHLFGQADAKVLREFLNARKGRTVPFWLPSWEADLTVSYNLGATVTGCRIHKIGYADSVFPMGNMRRHVQIASDYTSYVLPPLAPYYYRKITGSSSFDADEDVLFWSGGVTAGRRPLISFLRLCRLADDVQRIEWTATGFAACALEAVELPEEAP